VPIPPLPSSPGTPRIDTAWLATADAETLRTVVVELCTRVDRLEQENAALGYAAESFGALADRLNAALRAVRNLPQVKPLD
jgi:hypothetical protein